MAGPENGRQTESNIVGKKSGVPEGEVRGPQHLGTTHMGGTTDRLRAELEEANYTNVASVRDDIQLAQLEALEAIDQTLTELGTTLLRAIATGGVVA